MLIVLLVLVGVAFDPLHPIPDLPLAVVLAVQALHCLTPWRNRWTLAVQVVLLPWAGPAAVGPVAASSLLLLRGWPRWCLFAGVVATAALLVPATPFDIGLALLNALCQGLVLFGVTRLGDTRAAVDAARAELVARSVTDERSRAARDLDDAIGLGLSQIIAHAARRDLAEIVRISRETAALARAIPERATPATAQEDLMPRLALPILAVVHGGYLVLSLIYVGGRPAPSLIAAGILGLQFYHSLPRPPGELPRRAPWTTAALVALTVATLLYPGQPYPQLAGFLAGTFLLFGRAWWPAAAAAVGLLCAILAARGYPIGENLYWGFNAVAIAVMIYGLATQTRLVFEAHQTRLALAGIAVARERRRISHDVHDLLGQGLSAITVRAELACRLSAPDAVDEQIAEITSIAGRQLRALRTIALDEESDLSLDAEITSARSILEAAGIDVTVRRAPVNEGHRDRLLAIVLREAVTNVLRHSAATSCLIEITGGGLRVRNDGAGGLRGKGRGTANLAARVAATGGELTTAGRGGTYELRVLYPAVLDGDADGVEPVPRA